MAPALEEDAARVALDLVATARLIDLASAAALKRLDMLHWARSTSFRTRLSHLKGTSQHEQGMLGQPRSRNVKETGKNEVDRARGAMWEAVAGDPYLYG